MQNVNVLLLAFAALAGIVWTVEVATPAPVRIEPEPRISAPWKPRAPPPAPAPALKRPEYEALEGASRDAVDRAFFISSFRVTR